MAEPLAAGQGRPPSPGRLGDRAAAARLARRLGLGAVVLLLAGCGLLSPRTRPGAAPSPTPEPVVVAEPPAPPAPPPPPPPEPAGQQLLAWHDELRQFAPAALTREINRLAEPGLTKVAPPVALRLALALLQRSAAGDAARALSTLDAVLRSNAAEAQAWHGPARLLAARLQEQRRLEDQLDRQTQALRDTQRRLDATREQLEALKAIERSLSPRSPVPAPPPAPGGAAPGPASGAMAPAGTAVAGSAAAAPAAAAAAGPVKAP